jgi:hypothetical protein
LTGEPPEGDEVKAHVVTCATCEALLSDQAQLGRELSVEQRYEAPNGGLPSFLALEERLSLEQGPVAWLRALGSSTRLVLALSGVLALGLAQLLFNRRPDLELYPLARAALELFGYGLLLSLLVYEVVRPLQRPALAEGKRLGLLLVALLLPVAFALLPPAHASTAEQGAALIVGAASCFGYGLGLAVPFLGLLYALDRGAHRSVVLLSAAAAGGLSAAMVLHLHCPVTERLHLLLGHASIVAVLVTAYALYRRSVEQPVIGRP